MTLPPGLAPQAYDARARSPYAPSDARGPGGPSGAAPGPAPQAPRHRVLVGLLAGGVALLLGGVVAFTTSYLDEHADALLASPDDLPESGYDDEWTEVWADTSTSGTPDDPWPLGVTAYGPDWDVTLGTPRDATAEILAADPGGDAPAAGTEYWVVPVSAYYWGDDSALEERESVRLSFVDAAGTEHDASCGTVPGELVTTGRVAPDTTLVGNLCVAVPAGADGVWRLWAGAVPAVHLAVDDEG